MEKITLGGALLVGLGSAIGGIGRYLIGSWLNGRFPWGTFVANVSGCLLLGMLLSALGERSGSSNGRLLLGVGFLGGYTTFSTLMHDSVRLGPRTGTLNLVVSVLLGGLAVWLGSKIKFH
jgi:fluoride exporter